MPSSSGDAGRAIEQQIGDLARKNDRLFLEIPYRYFGKTCRYPPDFIVRPKSGDMLLIEGKERPLRVELKSEPGKR